MTIRTQTNGIQQTDVIIQEAIRQGFRELRKKPELLDYCFAGLANDDLTASKLGEGSIARARRWFEQTDISVRLNMALASPQFPCVSIELQQETEQEATLGDVHYQPTELDDSEWSAITPVFAATYDDQTGHLQIPQAIVDSILIFPGMVVVDRANQAFTIIDMVDEQTVDIGAQQGDFSACVLKWARPQRIVSLESLEFRGVYAIGCHVQGEAEHLFWLRSLVTFILLRYKQIHLEARGLERTTLAIQGAGRDERWGVEQVFTQYIQLTGSYRNYWPKAIGDRIQGIITTPIRILDGTATPETLDINQAEWVMEQDPLDGLKLVGIKGQAT